MDRISMKHHHKENELALMIHKITMKDFIQSKIKEYNISEEEINAQYKRFNQINDFQKTIMNIFYSKHFKIIEYNRIDIVRLLIIMGRELAEKDINTISQLVTAKVKSGDKGRNSGKTSFDILSDDKYQEALEMFTSVSDLLIRDNFILKLASIHSYNFVILNDDLEEVDMEEIDKKSFASEIADFIALQ